MCTSLASHTVLFPHYLVKNIKWRLYQKKARGCVVMLDDSSITIHGSLYCQHALKLISNASLFSTFDSCHIL